jgi:hypothetical protein
MSKSKPWYEITREERYFTAVLFHDLRTAPNPFWNLLRTNSISIAPSEVVDVAFEACFFRDAGLQKLVAKQNVREKQTFDFVLFLSTDEIVIIEAKAQQGFATDQIKNLTKAKNRIGDEKIFKTVYLAALFSSHYSPRESTIKKFDMSTTWNKLAQIPEYARNAKFYNRADSIYHL